ncbi:hypothetical protein [Erythrobacter aureus]|nr:hypothetical protein [Erythrobacter aureus]
MPQQKKTVASATFVATVTPNEIVKGNTSQGVRYSKMPGALIERKGRPSMTRTVMAFGRENRAVARSLREGKPVDVICQFDGGTVRIKGKADAKKAA